MVRGPEFAGMIVNWKVCDPHAAGSATEPVPQLDPTMQTMSDATLLLTVTGSSKTAVPGNVAVNAGELSRIGPEAAPPLTEKLAPDIYPAAIGNSRLAIFAYPKSALAGLP